MESVENRLTEIRDILNEMGIAVIDAAKDRATLRDQFAIAALTALLSSAGTMGTREGYCRGAYEYADAMLKAREAE